MSEQWNNVCGISESLIRPLYNGHLCQIEVHTKVSQNFITIIYDNNWLRRHNIWEYHPRQINQTTKMYEIFILERTEHDFSLPQEEVSLEEGHWFRQWDRKTTENSSPGRRTTRKEGPILKGRNHTSSFDPKS